MDDPFIAEGREAYQEGVERYENPYREGEDPQHGWFLGWDEEAAKEKQTEAMGENEGEGSFRGGWPKTNNPYAPRSASHYAWLRGWTKAAAQAKIDAGEELLQSVLTPVRPDSTVTLRNEGGQLVDDLGFWSLTAILCQRLGATAVGRDGPLFQATFPDFHLESRIYPTSGVAAVTSSRSKGKNGEALSHVFKLSEMVGERQSFTVEMHRTRAGRSDLGEIREGGLVDVTFAPVPERNGVIDGFELAKRYSFALGSFLEKPGRAHFVQNATPAAKRLGQGDVLELM